MTAPAVAEPVAQVIDGFPEAARAQVLRLRALIYAEAEMRGIGLLTETLKWGEPAYLSGRSGTTIRLAWKPKKPDVTQLLVHCGTNLVDRWRGQFPELTFEGNRALNLGLGTVPEPQLRIMIGQALTYHRG